MSSNLDITRFNSLKKIEKGELHPSCSELDVCLQSIDRGLKYCLYHYCLLEDAVKDQGLMMDLIGSYHRGGDQVPLRYVYEANISAFLSFLHAVLDSFPYLLNLFIPVLDSDKTKNAGWNDAFIKNYKDTPFYDELVGFYINDTFNKVKGYVNKIKHHHFIRIANKLSHLEFEEFDYRHRFVKGNHATGFEIKYVSRANVLLFLEECHDSLIPALFRLCGSVLDSKERQLENYETK